MIAVAASLAVIGIIQLGIGENVLFADDIQREKTAEFEKCKEIDFVGEECRKFDSRLEVDAIDNSGQKISVGIDDGVGAKGP